MIESLDRRTRGLFPPVFVGDRKQPLSFGAGFEVLGDDEQNDMALPTGIESAAEIAAKITPADKPWDWSAFVSLARKTGFWGRLVHRLIPCSTVLVGVLFVPREFMGVLPPGQRGCAERRR